jgi:hypothetical protein
MFLSPNPWIYPANEQLLFFKSTAHVPVQYQEAPIAKTINILSHGSMLNGNWVTNPMAFPVRPEIYEPYLTFQAQIKDCASLAEQVDEELRGFLERHSDVSPDVRNGLDFMGRRKLLSALFKSDKRMQAYEQFNSKAKQNLITSSFHRYIEDRNIYTHGILFFFMPQPNIYPAPPTKYVVKYIKERKELYCEVSPEILASYYKFGRKLLSFIYLINIIKNNNQSDDLERSLRRYESL